MASISLSLARLNDEQDSNITYFYDNCAVSEVGLRGTLRPWYDGAGIGLIMRRIVDEKTMDFTKVIDAVVTHRLQRAYFQKLKFRKMDLDIGEPGVGYSIHFEDILVTNLTQKFNPQSLIVMDVVSIEANYAELCLTKSHFVKRQLNVALHSPF